MQRKTYIKNAAILTITGFALRIAGMFFRVYIAARIGAEGMGLYQLIYTVYGFATTLATAGPVLSLIHILQLSPLMIGVSADWLTRLMTSLKVTMYW